MFSKPSEQWHLCFLSLGKIKLGPEFRFDKGSYAKEVLRTCLTFSDFLPSWVPGTLPLTPSRLSSLALSSVRSDYYSKRFTLSCLPQEKNFLPVPLMWLLALASPGQSIYISPQLDFEIIHVSSWANGVLADVMEAESWNLLVWLGLLSCSSVITMNRASSGYLLSLWPGCQKEMCGAGLRPPDCEEPRLTILTSRSTATYPSLAWIRQPQPVCGWVNEIYDCGFKPFSFEMAYYIALTNWYSTFAWYLVTSSWFCSLSCRLGWSPQLE